MQGAAEKLYHTLPYKPYATNNLKRGCKIVSREQALKCKYIQLNNPAQVSYLIFDVDYEFAGAAWLDNDLPMPTYIVQNKKNGHAHLIYRLSCPVTITENGREKPRMYLKAIKDAYTKKLGSDLCYHGPLCKNPFHKTWGLIDNSNIAYSLGDLAEYVELESMLVRKRREEDASIEGRNCTLFNWLRKWAYAAIREYWQPDQQRSFHRWHKAVLVKALEMNTFEGLSFSKDEPLGHREVIAVAKSVANWVWRKINPQGLEKLISRTHTPKQQRARAIKRWGNSSTRRQAALTLLSRGSSATEVASACGVSRSTVYRWAHQKIKYPVRSLKQKSRLLSSPGKYLKKIRHTARKRIIQKGLLSTLHSNRKMIKASTSRKKTPVRSRLLNGKTRQQCRSRRE